MAEPGNKPTFTLPQTALGRCALAAICVLLFPLSAFTCFASMSIPPEPRNVVELVVELAFRIVVEVFSLAMLVFSFFGIVWAVARPAWAEVAFQRAIRELTLAVGLLCLISVPVVFWAMWVLRCQGR